MANNTKRRLIVITDTDRPGWCSVFWPEKWGHLSDQELIDKACGGDDS
jgi:hypothetical protein